VKPSQETADRINVLRFPLIVGVVYIHAYGTKLNFRPPDLSGFLVDTKFAAD
jgi:hypothetical protein